MSSAALGHAELRVAAPRRLEPVRVGTVVSTRPQIAARRHAHRLVVAAAGGRASRDEEGFHETKLGPNVIASVKELRAGVSRAGGWKWRKLARVRTSTALSCRTVTSCSLRICARYVDATAPTHHPRAGRQVGQRHGRAE